MLSHCCFHLRAWLLSTAALRTSLPHCPAMLACKCLPSLWLQSSRTNLSVQKASVYVQTVQVANTLTQDNKYSRAASFTQACMHACVLARQLQDSQADIQELMAEVAEWQKAASETAAQLQQRDAQVLSIPSRHNLPLVHQRAFACCDIYPY